MITSVDTFGLQIRLKNKMEVVQYTAHAPKGLMPRHGSESKKTEDELTTDEKKHHLQWGNNN